MLTRYTLTLQPDRPCRPQAEWAYGLYAALLELAPADFASRAHEDGATPVSQFLVPQQDGGLRWTVSLLGEEAEALLSPVLADCPPLTLTRQRVTLTAAATAWERVDSVDALFRRAAGGTGMWPLRFRTPTAFKSRGEYLTLPTQRLILQSLMKQWNGCFPSCPIEDEDGGGLEAMASGLRCRGFQLRDRGYRLKGTLVPGFVGELTLENRLSGFHRELADALLLFSGYAGVGIKTALGMGGVTLGR
ncbi:MAG: CRISPR system precrRNA processing endoribonuclease RAMP protein Cas6 [Clostridiales bacterium]|nr:CRISPR system precrRNA processing endoribonuclease RAMP protein Cas6 [Clostridiales bacterium]